MFELLLSSGMGVVKTYPDSGPGTKELRYGTEDLGYFGEVSSSELFTLGELRRQTDFWSGTDMGNQNINWIKLFLSGKILYIPTTAVASSVSWSQLYAKGLVYGVGGPGAVPDNPAVNQLVYITKDAFSFKVRCLKTQVDDPANQGGLETIATTANLKASEWGRIISALISPRQNGYDGYNWNLYVYNSWLLYGTSQAVSQNTRAALASQNLAMNNTQVGLTTKSLAGYLWFPALEFTPVDQPVYLPIKDPIGISQGVALPVVVTDPAYEDGLIAYREFASAVQMGRQINTGDVEYSDPYYRVDTSTINMSNMPGVPVVVGDITYE